MSLVLEIAVADMPGREVVLVRGAAGATVFINGQAHRGALRPIGRAYELTLEDRAETVYLAVDRDTVYVHAFGRAWTVDVVDPQEGGVGGANRADLAVAPMPGTVIEVAVAPGESVAAGQQLVVIESMKMQSEIVASRDGVVHRVHVSVGDTFDRGAALVALEPDGDAES